MVFPEMHRSSFLLCKGQDRVFRFVTLYMDLASSQTSLFELSKYLFGTKYCN